MVDDEVTIVKVPPFAESLTEGDIRWDKGKLVQGNPKLMKYSHVFCCCPLFTDFQPLAIQ